MKPVSRLAREWEYNLQVWAPARQHSWPGALVYLCLRARYVWMPDERW